MVRETRRHEELDKVVILFAGDSGDGVQLTGMEFTTASAIAGNETVTLPSFPSEIRAPAGSIAGVSSYQIQFGSSSVSTPGDYPDVLVAFNPAALKANLKELKKGGILVVNEDAFTKTNLEKVGYDSNPCEDQELQHEYRVYAIPMSKLCKAVLKDSGLSPSQIERCKNYFALGVMLWLFERPDEALKEEIRNRFKNKATLAEANLKVLDAGLQYGDTAELFDTRFKVAPSDLKPGEYRNVNGALAITYGLLAASEKSGLPLFYAAYPITPATDILQELVSFQSPRVLCFQAEDEISAMCSAVGAAYAGALAVTGSSGPGISLKIEALGLAVITELPVVLINVQRAGPATGIPTRSEQADLLQAMYGRHGEAPLCILAASSPDTAFYMAYEAARIATKFMTPVVLMTEGYINYTFGPWRLPDTSKLGNFEFHFVQPEDKESYHPYRRNGIGSREWAIPGTQGLRHRVGGLERDLETGSVSNDGNNHEKMVRLREQKISNIGKDIPQLKVHGPKEGQLLVLGWGSTEGAIQEAVRNCNAKGESVSSAHLYYLNPFPENLGKVLDSFEIILIPEINEGQLATLIRARFLKKVVGLNRMNAEPIKVHEIESEISKCLLSKESTSGRI